MWLYYTKLTSQLFPEKNVSVDDVWLQMRSNEAETKDVDAPLRECYACYQNSVPSHGLLNETNLHLSWETFIHPLYLSKMEKFTFHEDYKKHVDGFFA